MLDWEKLMGLAGVFCFENGWIGRPWDNYYVIRHADADGDILLLSGDAWSLSLVEPKITSHKDYLHFESKNMSFVLNGLTHDKSEIGERAVLFFGDDYPDLTKLV